MLTVLGGLLMAVRPASAFPPTLTVTPGQYGHAGLPRFPYVYVPGETLTFTVSSNTAGETYDVVVYLTTTNTNLRAWDNFVIPASLSSTFTYNISALQDGTSYAVAIFDNMYIENGNIGFRYSRTFFAVQQYELRVEVDRPAYLGGDWVVLTWSANNLRGGALAPDGVGQVWVYDTAGGQLYTPPLPSPCCAYQFQKASGSFSFKIPNLADPRFDGIVMAWFNDTVSLPARFQQAFAFFEINSLSVIVAVNPKTYAPGGIVTTTVTTVVTRNQAAPSPFDPPEPGMNVVINVFQITPLGLVATGYGSGAQALQTDLHGKLTYVFQLLGTAPQSNYEVHAIATHPNTIWTWESQDTFTVSVSAGITQVLSFTANEFQAGDTAGVTSTVSGVSSGATLTYIFEVRDTTSAVCTTGGTPGYLLAKSTQASKTFQYPINRSFQGIICFRVTADDGQGNRVTTARAFTVVFGWLLVNADRREYNPSDTVTISWSLVSNRITNPSYFYEVRDSDGNFVLSGTTNQATSFPYPVPNPSSSRYTFTVTATELGRAVAGSITLTQVTGFFITASFDRNPPAYSPGETMTIHYTISARSANAVAPATYRITYGLLNGPTGGGSLRVSSTGAASGDLTYTVPTGIDEGDQLFQISEANTATQAIQMVTIRSTSPLWYVNIGDVPVLVLVMLVWLVLMTLLLWRKGVIGGMRPRAPREAPAGPTKQEPVHAAPGSPMTVTCRSCGSPIEITTSKRPIEVMCPKCGNTEVVS